MMRRFQALAQRQINDGAMPPVTTGEQDHAVALFTAVRQVSDEILHVHENKVGQISGVLGTALGFSDTEVTALVQASSLHDIGKFAIPSTILGKNGPLTPEEILEIKKHPANGAQILIRAGYSPDDIAVQIARCHHERFDGSGYPEGLAGTDIPFAARITAVADVYDALRALRPYKDAIDHAKALGILLQGDGRTCPEHFDPEVLEALLDCQESVQNTWESHSDSPVN